MPKLKSHKGAAARFGVTGSGKLRRMKGARGHNRRKKPARVRRLYSRHLAVSASDQLMVERMLPYR